MEINIFLRCRCAFISRSFSVPKEIFNYQLSTLCLLRNPFLYKAQCELSSPKSARKVLGFSRKCTPEDRNFEGWFTYAIFDAIFCRALQCNFCRKPRFHCDFSARRVRPKIAAKLDQVSTCAISRRQNSENYRTQIALNSRP